MTRSKMSNAAYSNRIIPYGFESSNAAQNKTGNFAILFRTSLY